MTGAGALLLASNACSFIFNGTKDQCETTTDCTSRGPEFAETICGADHTCSKNGLVFCGSTQDCATATNSTGQYYCRQSDHKCKEIKTQDCQTILADPGDVENKDSVWLGVITNLTGSADLPTGIGQMNSVELARVEIKTNLGGGLPAIKGGNRRPMVFVVCDEARDTANTAFVNSANHLAQDLEIKLAIGAYYSADNVTCLQKTWLPNGVIDMASSNTGANFTTLAKSDPATGLSLYYRQGPSGDYIAQIFSQKIFSKIEQTQKATGGNVPTGQPMKVAMVAVGTAFGQGYANGMVKYATFNGKSAADNTNDSNFINVNYGTVTDPKNPDAATAFAKAGNAVIAAAPHVIVMTGGGEITNITNIIEKGWTETKYHPLYVYLGASVKYQPLIDFVGTNNDLRQRLVGVLFDPIPSQDKTAFDYINHFQGKYNSGDPAKDGVANSYTAGVYDAVYNYALAIVANGDQPITGPNIAAQFKKFVPATDPAGRQLGGTASATNTFAVGPDGISAAIAAAQAGDCNLEGASGPLDYDLKTGDVYTDVTGWCISADSTGHATGYKFNNAAWDVHKQQLNDAPFSCKDAPTTPVGDGGT